MNEIISLSHAKVTLDERGVACLTIQTENHLNILGSSVVADLHKALIGSFFRPENFVGIGPGVDPGELAFGILGPGGKVGNPDIVNRYLAEIHISQIR